MIFYFFISGHLKKDRSQSLNEKVKNSKEIDSLRVESESLSKISDNTKNQSSKVTEINRSKFLLAPTPAQLGKAPLQKRQSQCRYFCTKVIFFHVFQNS